MQAMQYTIQLPSDYSTDIIVNRVQKRSQLFDDLPGMAHKSFLYNEDEKLYAPFYVWKDEEASRAFLLNDLFKGVIDSFSRPRVRQWHVLEMRYGHFHGAPTFAMREADPIHPQEDLQAMMLREKRQQEALLGNEHLYLHVVALDPDRWELVRYSVWKDRASASEPYSDCVTDYEVMHVSDPERVPA